MKRKVLLAAVIVASLYVGVVIGYNLKHASEASNTAQVSAAATKPPSVSELLSLVNAERAKVGVAPLKEDARLDASAQYKASDMVLRNYFDHLDPVTGKKNGLDFADSTNIKCTWVSENIFWGRSTNTSQSAITWWMNSTPHREALLDTKYSLTGFGIAENKVVEHFCQQ